MNIRQPSAARDAIGFFMGGVLAATSAGLVFLAFVPLGELNDGRNHAPVAFVMTILVVFIAGGFIGRRGVNADAWADFMPSILGTYAVVLGLPLLSGLSLGECMPFVGFASAGVVTVVVASLIFLRYFPTEVRCDEG